MSESHIYGRMKVLWVSKLQKTKDSSG